MSLLATGWVYERPSAVILPAAIPQDWRYFATLFARSRIEGEDYKDKPSDDLHRAVTDVFKAIANDLSGQKKPSALPQEKRQAFIDATRTIQQGADGQFTYTVVKQ